MERQPVQIEYLDKRPVVKNGHHIAPNRYAFATNSDVRYGSAAALASDRKGSVAGSIGQTMRTKVQASISGCGRENREPGPTVSVRHQLFLLILESGELYLGAGAAASAITEANSQLKIAARTSCSHQARPSGSSRTPLAQSRRCAQICGSR